MVCVECKEPIPEPPERYQSNAWYKRCKACARIYKRERYEARQEGARVWQRQYALRALAEQREFLNSYKADRECVDCGTGDPILEFDHVRGTKCFTIGDGKLWPRMALLAEIAKCELKCRGCHRKRHNKPP